MNKEVNYQNNPLHGVSLKDLLIELTSYYGFEILYAYLNINCFGSNASIASSLKFLKKTEWARERVEGFYLYEFKSLPRASAEQFLLSPRDRVIPEDQNPGEAAILSLEDAERLRAKREKKSAAYGQGVGHRSKSDKRGGGESGRESKKPVSSREGPVDYDALSSPSAATKAPVDPWAKSKEKLKH
ncbi:MAG: VF530 family DNA-binding protein [Immundisolibacteraceae bacterium]|nr:VF530 family DNA-binding protein [Immundisolibacteraceae bacterium]